MLADDWAIVLVVANAEAHKKRTPTLGTLLEEVAEYARAVEGKHEHTPSQELIEIGGIVVNLLRQTGMPAREEG